MPKNSKQQTGMHATTNDIIVGKKRKKEHLYLMYLYDIQGKDSTHTKIEIHTYYEQLIPLRTTPYTPSG